LHSFLLSIINIIYLNFHSVINSNFVSVDLNLILIKTILKFESNITLSGIQKKIFY
jgi:hypothetical protein